MRRKLRSKPVEEITCVNGHGEGLGHDCAYVDARNKLIPAAESKADTLMRASPIPKYVTHKGQRFQNPAWQNRWSGVFHFEMNKAARDAGLTR